MTKSPKLEVVLHIDQRFARFVEVEGGVDSLVDGPEDRDQRRLQHPGSPYVALQHIVWNLEPAAGQKAQKGVVNRWLLQQLRQHGGRRLIRDEYLEHLLVLVAQDELDGTVLRGL